MRIIKKTSRKIYYILLIIITVISLIYSISSRHGILKIIELENEIVDIKNDAEKIKKENEFYKLKIEALKRDRKAVESVARDELGMVREDEVLLLFKDK